ncbi:MAG: hypothetical protein NC095_01860 [Muribaculum sp.]|nr:hypothetical protein [Muribaculum sp.]
MQSRSDLYGYEPDNLLTSPSEVQARLNAILGDKVLRFNPYSVDDKTLLACVERAVWLPWPSLTQMVTFHFHDIRTIDWRIPYQAIFFHIGNDSHEQHLSLNSLTNRFTYTATLRQVHVTINGRVLTNEKMVERMQHKDYFISHALPSRSESGESRPAYRMFRLKGNDNQKAELIRQQMLESKITMLNEILAHPYTPCYLHCSRNLIDYSTPILAAIDTIRNFPDLRN